jgi:hypothetical protein
LGHEKRLTNNKATQAFRLAAQTMWQNKGPLGQLYKRLAVRKGSKKQLRQWHENSPLSFIRW